MEGASVTDKSCLFSPHKIDYKNEQQSQRAVISQQPRFGNSLSFQSVAKLEDVIDKFRIGQTEAGN